MEIWPDNRILKRLNPLVTFQNCWVNVSCPLLVKQSMRRPNMTSGTTLSPATALLDVEVSWRKTHSRLYLESLSAIAVPSVIGLGPRPAQISTAALSNKWDWPRSRHVRPHSSVHQHVHDQISQDLPVPMQVGAQVQHCCCMAELRDRPSNTILNYHLQLIVFDCSASSQLRLFIR